MPGVDYRLDISAMPQLQEAAFDAWICLHVLEHVTDDARALRELYRILKPGGFGALLVPISLTLAATEEDPGASAEERWRRFGQDDHVRLYAKRDFVSRVKSAGFTVLELGLAFFGKECFEKLALPETSVLYVVER
jgi:SAM-dependent methyltransferase